ncbi:MAG: hypothetical protein BWY05_00745 [Euryarchaeota archaeon ADurb.Bin165]|nr:MAG: hypothetical protein BWY05_00745 [Euryarchaeota archaeon ADurb.Bin165]
MAKVASGRNAMISSRRFFVSCRTRSFLISSSWLSRASASAERISSYAVASSSFFLISSISARFRSEISLMKAWRYARPCMLICWSVTSAKNSLPSDVRCIHSNLIGPFSFPARIFSAHRSWDKTPSCWKGGVKSAGDRPISAFFERRKRTSA